MSIGPDEQILERIWICFEYANLQNQQLLNDYRLPSLFILYLIALCVSKSLFASWTSVHMFQGFDQYPTADFSSHSSPKPSYNAKPCQEFCRLLFGLYIWGKPSWSSPTAPLLWGLMSNAGKLSPCRMWQLEMTALFKSWRQWLCEEFGGSLLISTGSKMLSWLRVTS